MAPRNFVWVRALILALGLCGAYAKDGFLLTMPLVLRHGSDSQFCLTMHGNKAGSSEAKLTFADATSGQEVATIKGVFTIGEQKCLKFPVPPPGDYKVKLTNSTDNLHDPVKVTVLDNKLITLVQTDKPIYKPGQKVRFRILTLLNSMMPRTGQIHSVYIKDPNDSRVKQYLNLTTKGISSLDFQLGKEAKLGNWKIEVNLDKSDETNQKSTVGKFTVKEYVLPRFEVDIEPPPYILPSDQIISGKVCGRYTYGKPVSGYLSLDLCWTAPFSGYSSPPTLPCYHMDVRLDGCYNFSVNASLVRSGPTYYYFRPELHIRAKITEDGTGATVSQNHTGPQESRAQLTIRLDDYTNSFFKPGLPYYGKVIVTKPDGSPASGETVKVTANSRDNSVHFSKTFNTDEAGVAVFSLCGGFTKATDAIKISALWLSLENPESPVGMRTVSGFRHVSQWFSPSLSYVQLPKFDSSHLCGQRLTLAVPYTTRAGSKVQFQYQVIARGQVVMTGQVDPMATATPGGGMAMPPSDMCLQKDEASSDRRDRITAPGMPGGGPFPIAMDEDIEQSGGVDEPVVWSDTVSDMVFSFLLDLEIKPIMSPKFTLLLHHVREDGEVVADSMQYNVEPCFENQVKLEFNESQALPGQRVNLNLDAAPGSVCGVGVVDKSVNILGGDHQITPVKIFDKIGEFSSSYYGPNTMLYGNDYDYCKERMESIEGLLEQEDGYWQYKSEYVDSLEAFKVSGSLVLTNLDLETRPCRQTDPIIYSEVARSIGPGVSNRDNGQSVRSNFPETWLWTVLVAGPEGEIVLTETAPDTITSWSANALCVSQEKGFGLSEVTSLTTFQPFFLSVHLPYVAVRGERLPVMLTVYNYLTKCITVQLTLDLGEEFKVHNSRQFRDPVCVCGGKSYTAKYYVTPKDIGSLPVVAKATIVAGKCRKTAHIDLDYAGMSDEVHRKMLVKAEGAEQSYTYASYLCSKDGKPLSEEVPLQLPKGKEMVRDSARGEVQVIGDIMGPALSNLDHLVRMPTGCGEQNMVGFVPNILVLNYLNSTGNLDETTRQKAISNMEIGYQRELNYRHKDGSFSAFGEKDPKGSVWLTSFVVKSFAQAQKHIFIDENGLQRSVDFLVRSQLETGCFRETGKVFSSYMMGGLGQGRGQRNRDPPQGTLTAYVLMALMEAGVDTSNPTIDLGIQCMNRELRSLKNRLDSYTLAQVTLANMKYNSTSPDAQFAFKTLQGKAQQDDMHMYWTRGKSQPPATNTWFYQAAPSAEVEMTSYALMSYLQLYQDQAVKMSHKISMWLNRQRNSFGGFASTQDTVVGLEALSQFAALAYSRDLADLKVKVMFNSTTAPSNVEFSVSEGETNTRFLLQSKPIPALPTTLHISTSGTGCALVQANVRYNKPPRTYLGGEKPKFTLKVYARPYQHDPDRCDHRTLSIRVGSRKGHTFSKGMGLLTLRMVTGWSPTSSSLTKLNSLSPKLGIMRIDYEEEEGVLSLYFDEFSRKAKRFTMDVIQDQDLRVSNPKAADVRVVEYYETDVTNVKQYRIKTTCGTKAEIPRYRPNSGSNPLVPVRMDEPATVDILQHTVSAGAPAPPNACPACITTRKIPTNFRSAICNASAVYKALAGRKGARPLKLRQDLRPKEMLVGLEQFASYRLPPGCNCSLLSTDGGPRRVIIVTAKKVSGKYLTLDRNSIIMKTTMKAEKEARAAQETCPLQKE
ncbi:alpha-2-macroglobulin-like protein [Plakobranchus ocellatus]|uniref:Alpha-2-macroglobulin-like protein n=1 Tax=Plakobranchus ocellatus TaxID=259542 RepID=A0AAV4CW00_9GAST|nr:alpha-2-macroglobulin-like protein [Plakobranchus ocellatus]